MMKILLFCERVTFFSLSPKAWQTNTLLGTYDIVMHYNVNVNVNGIGPGVNISWINFLTETTKNSGIEPAKFI